MRISVLICTHGSDEWAELAYTRAYPSLIGQDPWETIIHHERNATLAQTRNNAAKESNGAYLLFLDADDELHPECIQTLSRARWGVEPSKQCLYVPQVQYVSWNGYERPPEFPNREHPFTEMNHAVIGTLVPRNLFMRVGGFKEERIYEDWALWLRCIRAGAELVYVPGAIYRAFLREGSRNVTGGVETYEQIKAEHVRLTA